VAVAVLAKQVVREAAETLVLKEQMVELILVEVQAVVLLTQTLHMAVQDT
jgi:hypothetical protein